MFEEPGYWRFELRATQYGEDTLYELVEAYYNADNELEGTTEEPITFSGTSPEEVVEELEMAIKDIKSQINDGYYD